MLRLEKDKGKKEELPITNYHFSGDIRVNNIRGLKQFGFILELLTISAVLSYLIKYGGSYLSISATSSNALVIVIVPALVMAIALGVRYALVLTQRQNNS